MDLTDEQWKLLEPLIPQPPRRQDGRGRPWRDPREVLNGILWVLRTGAPWKDMPERYPPYQTCHRRFQGWVEDGTVEKILRALAEDLERRGEIDLSEAFIDGTFAPARKGGSAWAKPSGARGPRSWQSQTALVFLSPYVSRVLGGTKYDLSRTLLKVDFSRMLRRG
jgi:transposase